MPDPISNEKLQLLHDHYKDTFSLIRDRERQRDRLFLVVIGLYSAVASAVFFSAGFGAALKGLEIAGAKADLSTLPAGAVLGALWAFTLAMTLRYCQVSIAIERQYAYLHAIEERVSKEFDGLYRREGGAYLENYPAFSVWAWISYTLIFPLALMFATIAFTVIEWSQIPSSWIFKSLDTLLAIATCITLALYRLTPVFRKYYLGAVKRRVAPPGD